MKIGKTSVVLLAGGTGTRMQASLPKQFLELGGKLIVLHSFDLFLGMAEIDEIVIVCAKNYRELFCKHAGATVQKAVRFAQPGLRRQDSVYNGLLETSAEAEWVCIHDAARPFIDQPLVYRVLEAAKLNGAAAPGVPLRFTVKEWKDEQIVKSTPDRSKLWEIQTPQVVKKTILQEGFRHAEGSGITVTDDVSLAENVGHPVKLVKGSERNIKITLPEDLLLANHLLHV